MRTRRDIGERRAGALIAPGLALVVGLTLSPACRNKDEVAPVKAGTAAGDQAATTGVADAPGAPSEPLEPALVAIPAVKPVPAVPRGLPASTRRLRDANAALYSLGELLFFEPRLSATGKVSCASCHAPDKGFADGLARSETVGGKPNLRHTPSLYNLAWADSYYWDGRAPELATTILASWRGQMGAEPDLIAQLLSEDPAYALHAERALNTPLSTDGIIRALAAYQAAIYSGDSPWDRHEAGELGAVSEAAVRGFQVFSDRAQCAVCHPPPLFTDHRFHDIGLARGLDPGRAVATKAADDEAKFKTPTLRGLSLTAPYFHDGSASSLEAVLDHKLAAQRLPVILTPAERADLIEFLGALSPAVAAYPAPQLRATAP